MPVLDLLISLLLFCPTKNIETFPEDYNLSYEEVSINVDEDKLHGWFIPGESKKDKFIIYLHGSQGNIGIYLKGIKKLHSSGANILVADYRGFGRSTGKARIKNTIEDGIAMVEFLRKEKNAKHISLFGYSYGGALAAELASRMEINAIAIESTFASLERIAREKYPIVGRTLVQKKLLNTIEKIEHLNIPKLIAYAEHDQIVPVQHSLDMYEKAASKKSIYEIKGARHDNICDFITDEYVDLVTQTLTQ